MDTTTTAPTAPATTDDVDTVVPTQADAHALNLLVRASASLASTIAAARSELDALEKNAPLANVYAPRLTRVIEEAAKVSMLVEMSQATNTTPEQRAAARNAREGHNAPYFTAQR